MVLLSAPLLTINSAQSRENTLVLCVCYQTDGLPFWFFEEYVEGIYTIYYSKQRFLLKQIDHRHSTF